MLMLLQSKDPAKSARARTAASNAPLLPVAQHEGSIRDSGPPGFRILAVFRRFLALGEVLAEGSRRHADEATELLGEVVGACEARFPGHHTHG